MSRLRRFWPYAKAIVAFLIPSVQLALSYYTDHGTITGNEWRDIGLGVVGAALVYLVPNKGYPRPGDRPAVASFTSQPADQTIPRHRDTNLPPLDRPFSPER